MNDLMEIIKGRKSVRTYDGKPLSEEHRKLLEDFVNALNSNALDEGAFPAPFAKGAADPFSIPVEFVLLDAKEHGLSSSVLSGEPMYVTGKVEKKPYADVAFGYAFERLVLYAWSLGVGTVWIGGTMKREVFEKAAGLKTGEMMPCVSPLGYPAAKRTLKESLMRKGVGADNRISAEKLFFDETWGNPLKLSGDMGEILEMVRWAPSAVNKQPWRIIRKDGVFHFYEKKDKGYVNDSTGDLQKIDVGIALCHFVLGLEDKGLPYEIVISNPEIEIPDQAEYIVSVKTGSPA